MSEQEPVQVVVKPQVVVVKRGGLSCCGCSCAIPIFVILGAALVALASVFGSALALLLLPLGLVGAAQALGGSGARRGKPAGASARRPSTRERNNLTKAFPLWVICLYQHTLSLDHGPLRRHFPQGYCRYEPSCSEYTGQAIEKYGLLQGGRLAVLRILRCHPWSGGDKDDVPELHAPPALDVWRQQSRLPTIGTVKEGGTLEFSDLPLVESEDAARRVHRTAGLYLVKRGGVAHGTPYSCLHIDPEQTVGKSIWRVATDAECRALGIRWCESCS